MPSPVSAMAISRFLTTEEAATVTEPPEGVWRRALRKAVRFVSSSYGDRFARRHNGTGLWSWEQCEVKEVKVRSRKMKTASIAQEIASLPPEAQRQVIDLVAFMKMCYPTWQIIKGTEHTQLADEPFVGMWREREDMQDSTAWVRDLRRREWERS